MSSKQNDDPVKAASTGADLAIYRTSGALWAALSERAGLTPLTASGGAGYDLDLVTELRDKLLDGRSGDFSLLLERAGISTERLLHSFLRAIAPFAKMMSEILAMFERASARRSDQNLRIAIDFDAMQAPFEFDLNAFREQVRSFETAIAMVQRRHWNIDTVWGLIGDYNGLFLFDRPHSVAPDKAEPELPADVETWLEAMRSRDHSFPAVPDYPATGIDSYDAVLSNIWSDVRDFQEVARERIGTYLNSVTLKGGADYHGWSWPLFPATHDQWTRGLLEYAARLGAVLKTEPVDPEIVAVFEKFRARVAAITLPPEPAETICETLEDVLSLPVWQRRHELYSIWVAAVITRQLGVHGIEFHVEKDVLSFPFKPTHLATIGTSEHSLELWSELRTPAGPNPLGRVAAIQPDYRLRIAGANHPKADSDLLVVECKQYRRSNAANFSEALSDYAEGCPESEIALVNYGPVGAAVGKRIKGEIADRCHPIGLVRPLSAGRWEFEELLIHMASSFFEEALRPAWLQGEIEVTLRWCGAVDLDLHVVTPDGRCDYKSPTGLAEAIFRQDDRGEGPGEHSETIIIRPADSEQFDIVVTVFAGADTLRDVPSAEVWARWRQKTGAGESRLLSFFGANARHWHVATFKRGLSQPLEPDCATDLLDR